MQQLLILIGHALHNPFESCTATLQGTDRMLQDLHREILYALS